MSILVVCHMLPTVSLWLSILALGQSFDYSSEGTDCPIAIEKETVKNRDALVK